MNPYVTDVFFIQFFSTAMLVALIFAVIDSRNDSKPDKGLAPLIIGFIVFMIGMTFGFNCGYAINPARDLAPRIFTAMAGWGADVFTYVHTCYHHNFSYKIGSELNVRQNV